MGCCCSWQKESDGEEYLPARVECCDLVEEKEIQHLKASIPEENVQMDCSSSEPQQGGQCGIDVTNEGKVSLENFQCIKMLAKGGFGTVVLAKGKLPGRPEEQYAIKALKKEVITSISISQIFAEKEALILTSGYPFVTTLHCCFQNNDHLFFVLEYVSGGDLRDQLAEVEVFSQERSQFYAAEITLALQFLHKHGIMHRDLKPENVLVGSDGHLKISDYGLCKTGLFHDDRASTICGTRLYMAPEMLEGLPYGHSVDWWALGIMVFEMLTGRQPYNYGDDNGVNWWILVIQVLLMLMGFGKDDCTGGGGDDKDERIVDDGGDGASVLRGPEAKCNLSVDGRDDEEEEEEEEEGGCDDDEDEEDTKLFHRIINNEVDFPEDLAQAAISLVSKLLIKNPSERLGADGSVDTIRQHPFFEGIDWQALEEKRVNPPEKEKKPEEDKQTFSNILMPVKTGCNINQDIFKGFSLMNYGGKQG